MIRRPPRSTLFPYHDALPICTGAASVSVVVPARDEEASIATLVASLRRPGVEVCDIVVVDEDRKSTRLNSSHANISYAVFCLKKKKTKRKRHNNQLQ